ncbi:hypothetical protein [Actinoplanes sp. L3-i22]|uniref:hypothetical protein n=1 Tax=Actinoplanes sp. L3-i22 TaxID=2836373 RepID=UPI001C78952C|nr:hypothetical protein [Actinoplanes sp. L3-i22]BCY08815.1 hypothetical protein L3i22_039030 [Actinoplanes sp. L3-i22]
MTFSVEPADMRAYAAKLLDLSDDAIEGKAYTHRYGDIGITENGIFGALLMSHSRFMTRLDDMSSHLKKLTDSNHQSLMQIARGYEAIDHRSAAEIDDSYPTTQRPMVFKG